MGTAAGIQTVDAVVDVNGQPFAIVLEKGPRNWSAFAPDVPGCLATGATEDEVKQTLQEAIELHLEASRKVRDERPWLYDGSVQEAV